MKIRQHRGTLVDSMSTIIEIPNTKEAIFELVNKTIHCSIDSIQVKYYAYDDRIDWDCYIVSIDGFGVYGFTDSDIIKENV